MDRHEPQIGDTYTTSKDGRIWIGTVIRLTKTTFRLKIEGPEKEVTVAKAGYMGHKEHGYNRWWHFVPADEIEAKRKQQAEFVRLQVARNAEREQRANERWDRAEQANLGLMSTAIQLPGNMTCVEFLDSKGRKNQIIFKTEWIDRSDAEKYVRVSMVINGPSISTMGFSTNSEYGATVREALLKYIQFAF